MNSLVSYGMSSDSEEEVEDVNIRHTSSLVDDGAAKKTRNFLLESGSASSDSEPEDPEPSSTPSSVSCQSTLPAPSVGSPTANKLPSPSLNASADSSVFANPFRAQAEQKLSALQKHVPLTMQAKPSQIGGKRVCVSYRKDGRCRFGIKCKFAHDSDLQTPGVPADCHPDVTVETPASAPAVGGGSRSLQLDDKESEQQQTKKRRVGLSNSLIPPKRTLKQYALQREQERINMS
ncbi:uncharacterized protein si:ch211-113e8.11 [Austrofundulus limnaeus]|uniref:Uncharacterized protein si:ch211-113e8.11 n=1 Tax=Austrofundulus limnaeus TaxID=52670 RepID=A0A2I4BLN4_AUSLI|nr:PREDICTED: uncharacterized protein LOC106520905 [Austrofundulus limnaeus]